MNYINFKTGKIKHHKPEIPGYIEIDDLMCPIIFELNRKGYITKYCCQGHIEDKSTTYIMFEYWVKLPSIPENWYLDDTLELPTIRYKHNMFIYEKFNQFEDFYKVYNHLVYINSELYNWAKSLPDYESILDCDYDEC